MSASHCESVTKAATSALGPLVIQRVHFFHPLSSAELAELARRTSGALLSGFATMPKRHRDECSPLADGALEAKILELVRKRGITKTC